MNDGHRPIMAYQVAFGLNLALQMAAMVWFALPWLRSFVSWMSSVPLFTPANACDAIKSVGVYENSVVLLPADEDAEW